MATVLILGSGCREHALAWKLSQSSQVKKVIVAPGNGGTHSTDGKIQSTTLNPKNVSEVTDYCKQMKPSIVVVGPEDPLNCGVADAMAKIGIACFGPSQAAAQIECDKVLAKKFMQRHDIPTAAFETFSSSSAAISFVKQASFNGFVVKAAGLAAGKGVVVTDSQDQAIQEIKRMMDDRIFGDAGSHLVIEEKLEGYEVSVLAFSDGSSYSIMPPAQDHKRAYDGDEGPNTGGMGAFSPIAVMPALAEEIEERVVRRAIAGMKSEAIPFVGVLYAGIMVTSKGPQVLEFNCRFGDPETQVLLPLLETDLYEVITACTTKSLDKLRIKWKTNSYAVGVVVASENYPASPKIGRKITGIEEVEKEGMTVFHGGTKKSGNDLLSSGGRVLTVVSVRENLKDSIESATRGAGMIHLEGSFFRHDIAIKGLARSSGLTYKSAGVDIMAGEALVDKIKLHANRTSRSGVMESLGGFGALFDLKPTGYSDPILVSGTDGVGTKLRVALENQIFDSVGIDLVAMCVNDILVQGAEPLFFLDYFACGSLNVDLAAQVIGGIARGCAESGCALVGGETAEMPGMYSGDDFDLAGFCVGVVERNSLLPRTEEMREGDVIIGLPSSGIHSNGFSLVRKLVEQLGLSYSSPAPFDRQKTLGQALLTPTKLYVKPLFPIIRKGVIKGLAHITGGGLLQNIPRILPKNLTAELDASQWSLPPVFSWIQREGKVQAEDMLLTFNCGIGMVVIVNSNDSSSVLAELKEHGTTDGSIIGRLTARTSEGVVVKNFSGVSTPAMSIPAIPTPAMKDSIKKKRVAVLISGNGTNLQALIDGSIGNASSSADICLVISNVDGVRGLARARKAGIKTLVIPHKGKQRIDFDMEVHKGLTDHAVEFVFLAGFMRILSAEFVQLWEGKLVNIHPSLLPSFKGMHTHQDALAAGVTLHGCTVHFVDAGVDTGPIIAQEAVAVFPGDTPETLKERVQVQAEHKVYPRALELVTSGQVVYDFTTKKVVRKM